MGAGRFMEAQAERGPTGSASGLAGVSCISWAALGVWGLAGDAWGLADSSGVWPVARGVQLVGEGSGWQLLESD